MQKILITGGTGLVGSALSDYIRQKNEYEIFPVGSKDADLRDFVSTKQLFQYIKPDYVIHLAGKVGGVKANTEFVGDFYRDNILINTHILELAREFNVSKTVSLMSTCIYPDQISYPISPEDLHKGPPHESNFGYAYAKRMLDIQSRAYRKQYGCNFINVIPNNTYGPNDNFDVENGHVIPSLIMKIHEAKILRLPSVNIWGDGTPLRQFTYSYDLASSIFWAFKNYHKEEPINIGNPMELSIKYVAETIKLVTTYTGEIEWDTSKPKGQHRKYSKIYNIPGQSYLSLVNGLAHTYSWFKSNYPKVRR